MNTLNTTADLAFAALKQTVIAAHILKHADLSLPLMFEGVTSQKGIGVMFS